MVYSACATEAAFFSANVFSGSAVSSLSIQVDDYPALKTLVVNDYDVRLVDVLDVKRG